MFVVSLCVELPSGVEEKKVPSKYVGAMSHWATGENEAEDRLPLARTLGIAMVAVLVACDSAAVPLSFGMILNSSSIVPKNRKKHSFSRPP